MFTEGTVLTQKVQQLLISHMTCKRFNDKYIIKSKPVVFFHKTRSTTFPFDQQPRHLLRWICITETIIGQ